MDVIDEQGRLFGLVNVIDALVVLLVAAVVVAGVALVLQEPEPSEPSEPSPEPATRYATITFGSTSPEVADALAAAVPDGRTRIAPGGNANVSRGEVNVTDLYRVPGDNGKVFVVARVAMTGRVDNGTFALGGHPIRVGNAVRVVGDAYALKGRITALNRSGTRLPTGATRVVMEAQVPTTVASTLAEGESYRVGTSTGATVESVSVYPTGKPAKRRVHLGVRLRTLSRAEGPHFAGRAVRVGRTMTVVPNDTAVKGSIVALGTSSPPGDQTNLTVQVAWHDVAPALAGSVTAGTTERLRDDTTARVVDSRVAPETVFVRAENGTIHSRDHPRLKNVTLTVDLTARRLDEGLLFHGRRLQLGRTVVFDFGAITVKGRLIAIEGVS